MNKLVDQLPALLGVIVGGVMSYLTASSADRRRWRREQAARWDSRVLQVYSDYGSAVRDCFSYYQRLAASRGMHKHPAPVEPTAEALEYATSLDRRRTAAHEPISLLADTATTNAVRNLNRRLWRLEWLARGYVNGTAQDWAQAFAEYQAARSEFYRCARTSLGIAELGELEDGPWPFSALKESDPAPEV